MNDFSRRTFLRQLAAGGAALSLGNWHASAAEASSASTEPWYRRTLRWGQVNLTENDPQRFDLTWWKEYWKRTALQGLIVNAGGITAYYPTQIPLHRRAAFLGDRDLFGEIREAARAEGLAVFARMDSNRADEEFYRAHPDWFARDAEGKPYRTTDLYIACVNGPYYEEYLPAILREIATRYRPEGFTDNNWNGPMRNQPCFCENCAQAFRARSGAALPTRVDWDSAVYRDWIRWNYERRLALWERFNQETRTAGGPECVWVGMMSGSLNWQARVFRDDREIYRRAEIVMLDHQRRHDDEGFAGNGEAGKRIHSVGGWDKLVPESMAMYHLGEHNFRLAAKPAAEAQLWALEGIAGDVQPWWHMIGSVQEDRRILETAVPLWQWHRANERYLFNRRPLATVGLVWSQRNVDFFGRDEAGVHTDEPWNGFTQALVRARIPYVPVHVDDVARVSAELGLKTLILPNLAALSDAQAAAIRQFVAAGGGLLATGLTSLCTEEGETRPDFALADLFGVHLPPSHGWKTEATRTAAARGWTQTYLRLPPTDARRGQGLPEFAGTDILAFGGALEDLVVAENALVPLTLVPAVPVMPVEKVWMREPRTAIPGLVLTAPAGRGRVAYLPADLDRRFARDNLPDHGDLLASVVRWTANEAIPLRIDGAGLVDCHLYRQESRVILHLVNLTNAGTWRTPVHEFISVEPLKVQVTLPSGVSGASVRALVASASVSAEVVGGVITFTLPSVRDHEVLVIE